MKRLFERLLPAAIWLALAVVAARLVAAVAEFFLPPLPTLECRYESPRARALYPFAEAFGLQVEKSAPPVEKSRPRPRKKVVSLGGYRLSMTAVGDPSMAIVVKNGKSRLLSVGERVDGFRLEEVYTDRVKFTKNGTEYWLAMKSPKSKGSAPLAKKPPEETEPAEQIRQEGDTYYVPRELLDRFRDTKKIFKYISIKPIYKNNALVGFGVSRVQKGSVFDKMGLRKRDIITAINGEKLTGETQAFKYFNRLDELGSLTLKIKRGSEEKELHYEIF